MFKPFCDSCKKPLEDSERMIIIPEIIFIEDKKKMTARNLHLCDKDCCHSFIVKAANRPVLITPSVN